MRSYFNKATARPLEAYWADSPLRKELVAALKDKGWTREYILRFDKAGSYCRLAFANPKEKLALEVLSLRPPSDIQMARRRRREMILAGLRWKIVYLQEQEDGKVLLINSYPRSMIAMQLAKVFGERLVVI